MVALGLSEFSFGFAFLFEQVQANWGDLRAAPVLPSLQKEAEAGWDANLPMNGVDFYYQFKISDYLCRKTARHRKDGTYDTPYFRMPFHTRNNYNQHQRLRLLSQTFPTTFYVTLEVDSIEEFNSAFLSRSVTSKTRLFRVVDCEDIDDDEPHYITFRKNNAPWTQHSLPKKHEKSASGADLAHIYAERFHAAKQPLNKEYAVRLFHTISERITGAITAEEKLPFAAAALDLLDFQPHGADRTGILLRVSDMLSAFYGATLVLVGE